MTQENAPLHEDIARAPAGGSAYWLTCSDGVKIRAAVWDPQGAPKGTVLIYPGRTEYIEKYGIAVAGFVALGYACVVIDWRGQGLADRLLPERSLGHVADFADYQLDVDAVLGLVDNLSLPKPFFLFGHSMGGCIGLRTLVNKGPIAAAIFTGPMWGIALSPHKRSLGWVASTVAHNVGLGNVLAPGTSSETYVLSNPFEGNMLTTDRDMFDMMRDQITKYPDLSLGGPSLTWLNQALVECRTLRAHPTPNVPAICYLGTNERIVDKGAIEDRMSRWPNGTLVSIDKGEHEIVMENLETRERLFAEADALFSSVSDAPKLEDLSSEMS